MLRVNFPLANLFWPNQIEGTSHTQRLGFNVKVKKLMHLIYRQLETCFPVRGALQFTQPWCKPSPSGEWEQWNLQTSHEGLVIFYSCPPHICWYHFTPWSSEAVIYQGVEFWPPAWIAGLRGSQCHLISTRIHHNEVNAFTRIHQLEKALSTYTGLNDELSGLWSVHTEGLRKRQCERALNRLLSVVLYNF